MGNTPNIRFKGFADDWEQRKLGEYSELITKGTTPSNFCEHGNVTFVKIEALREKKVIKELCSFISEEIHKGELARSILKENDIVFAIAGTIGKCAVITRNILPANTNQALAIIRLKSSINKDFVYFSLTSKQMEIYINQCKSVGAQPNLSLAQMNAFEFLCPCKKEEQQKIGGYFSTLDYLITLHQRKCDEVKQLKKFMLQKMFPKSGELIPEIRFAGFTGNWEQCKLGDVVNIGSGMDYKGLGEGKIPVYGTGGYMLSVDKALSYDKDAVGIGRKGTIDKPYILKAPFWTVDTLFYCIPKENFDLNFVYSIFQNINWKQKDESTGVPSLSKVIINSTKITIPSLYEQIKIGLYFENLDYLITLHQRKCDELQGIKKFMLQKMFV